jgi:hypothetical protein
MWSKAGFTPQGLGRVQLPQLQAVMTSSFLLKLLNSSHGASHVRKQTKPANDLECSKHWQLGFPANR